MEMSETSEVVVVNVFIHKESKMSRKAFLKRVNNVQAIRTTSNWEPLTWRPANFKEFRFLEHFHSAITTGDFSGFSDHVFGILVAPSLYTWFAQNKLSTVQRQITNYFAAKYIRYESQRATLRDELYPLLFYDVLDVIKNYYGPETSYNMDVENSELAKQNYERLKQDYVKASIRYAGAAGPPEIFKDFHEKNYWMTPESELQIRESWGMLGGQYKFNFRFESFYFTETDWEEIVIKGSPDELRRAEAKADLWEKWKLTFDRWPQTKTHVFQLTSDAVQRGFMYVFQEGESNVHKIGFSNTEAGIEERRKTAQTYSHEAWRIRGYFPVASQETEHVLHNILKRIGCHIRGELFSLSDDQANNILDEEWRRKHNIF